MEHLREIIKLRKYKTEISNLKLEYKEIKRKLKMSTIDKYSFEELKAMIEPNILTDEELMNFYSAYDKSPLTIPRCPKCGLLKIEQNYHLFYANLKFTLCKECSRANTRRNNEKNRQKRLKETYIKENNIFNYKNE